MINYDLLKQTIRMLLRENDDAPSPPRRVALPPPLPRQQLPGSIIGSAIGKKKMSPTPPPMPGSKEDLAMYMTTFDGKQIGIAFNMADMEIILRKMTSDKSFSGRVSDYEGFMSYFQRTIVGMIAIQKAKQSCNDAYEVKLSAGKGRGKLVYGMGYFMAKDCYLIPDRNSVSLKAQDAWLKVSKSVKGIPLEDHCGDVKNSKAACMTWKVRPDGMVKSQEVADALNQAYCKPSNEYDFKAMLEKTSAVVKKYNLDESDFASALKKSSINFFSDQYEPPAGVYHEDDCLGFDK